MNPLPTHLPGLSDDIRSMSSIRGLCSYPTTPRTDPNAAAHLLAELLAALVPNGSMVTWPGAAKARVDEPSAPVLLGDDVIAKFGAVTG